MAAEAVIARVALVLCVASLSRALTIDEDVTRHLQQAAEAARDGGEVAVVVERRAGGRGGGGAPRDLLLNAKTAPDEEDALALYYNRRSHKVTLEAVHGGYFSSVSWALGTGHHSKLVLVISSTRVRLFNGCRNLHSHATPARRDLLEFLSSQQMKLYHEEQTVLEVHGSERAALDVIGCDAEDRKVKKWTSVGSDVQEVKDFLAKDARRKREDEKMQADHYISNNYIGTEKPTTPTTYRGDIPLTDGVEVCDDEVIRQLTLLRETIQKLSTEIADQKRTIQVLRQQLQQCCRAPSDSCTSGSCYPGY